jgi:hypothetical protein
VDLQFKQDVFMKQIFIVFWFIIVALGDPGAVSAEFNVTAQAGLEHFTWDPGVLPGTMVLKGALDTKAYELASYNLGFIYNNSTLLNIDYYKPLGSRVKGSYYVNELNRISFAPLSFLSVDPSIPWKLRILFSINYVRDYKEFKTTTHIINPNPALKDLIYYDLSGVTTDLNKTDIRTYSSFKYQEWSLDLFSGFERECIKKDANWLDRIGYTLSPILGYFESHAFEPIGVSTYNPTIQESITTADGVVFGLRSKDRTLPGLYFDLIFAGAEGAIRRFNSRVPATDYERYLVDVWFNQYFTWWKLNILVTLGYSRELVEVKSTEMDGTWPVQLDRSETFRKIYVKAGFKF